MGVRIDAARHDIASAGVDNFRARGGVDSGADRDDHLAVNNDIRAPRMIGVYDRAAADDERGHEKLRTANSEQPTPNSQLRTGKFAKDGMRDRKASFPG